MSPFKFCNYMHCGHKPHIRDGCTTSTSRKQYKNRETRNEPLNFPTLASWGTRPMNCPHCDIYLPIYCSFSENEMRHDCHLSVPLHSLCMARKDCYTLAVSTNSADTFDVVCCGKCKGKLCGFTSDQFFCNLVLCDVRRSNAVLLI